DRIAFNHQTDACADPQPGGGRSRGGTGDEHLVGVNVVAGQLIAPGVGGLSARWDVGVVAEQQRAESARFGGCGQLDRRDAVMDWEVSKTEAHVTSSTGPMTHLVREPVVVRT